MPADLEESRTYTNPVPFQVVPGCVCVRVRGDLTDTLQGAALGAGQRKCLLLN